MQELISKLEAASGGSKELDAEIADAVGVASRSRRTASGKSKGREWFVDSHGGVQTWAQDPPPYTTSLDAALTLVPEGWTGIIPVSGGDDAWLWQSGGGAGRGVRVSGTTPALALTIAALKARFS